jgi:hypothetical protein
MKRALLSLAVLAGLAAGKVLAAEPARLNLVAFDRFDPLAKLEVMVDGAVAATTNADGAAQLTLEAGARVLELRRAGEIVARYEFTVVEGDSIELIATLRPDAEANFAFESAKGQGATATAGGGADAGPPGTLTGRIVNSEDGKPIANARIFVSGTPLDLRTDDAGEFQAELPPGSYALSVIATDFAAQTIEGVAIVSKEVTTKEVELTPAGLELPEFVVLEPYVEGSLAAFVEEKRTSFAVTEVLGAEQISRAGDSDAAGALRRVTGLTLVDGKFVYVRGLGERYSSVLLNGAQIPSPDPTRKVVPLDLFPTEILDGIVIQKTFSADMPGEFGGGTIQLRTKNYPETFFFKLSGTLGYADGTSFEDGLRYDGGGEDWTGYDDGTRELPDSLQDATAGGRLVRPGTPPTGFTPEQLNALGRDLSTNYNVDPESIDPNTGFTISLGNSYPLWDDDVRAGYLASVRYSQGWDTTDEIRRAFVPVDQQGTIVQTAELDRLRTERSIELSGFLAAGLDIGEDHSFKSTTVLLRQSSDETRTDEGFPEDPSDIVQLYLLEWIENEMFAQQIAGEHRFPWLANLALDWQYTFATAAREAPNTREYRYDFNQNANVFELRPDRTIIGFGELDDENQDLFVNLKLPFEFENTSSITLLAGTQLLRRERESGVRRFQFLPDGQDGSVARDPVLRRQRPDAIFAPGNFGPTGWTLRDATRPDDAYTAEQDLDAVYLGLDADWKDEYRLTLGARQEKNDQVAATSRVDTPNDQLLSAISTDDVLPSVSATWVQSETSQWRLGYSETVSRPEFRELTPAAFIDPLTDNTTIGNPDLEPTSLKNYDFRWEYYFSTTESFSAALFLKEFDLPIEQVQVAGSGELFTFQNAVSARNYGVEFDLYKNLEFAGKLPGIRDWRWLDWVPWSSMYVSTNYSKIESSVDLGAAGGISTNVERPLQGQSPYVGNFQVGYQNVDNGTDWTLLYNVFGRRISTAGTSGAPDIYEEPFNQLDFVFSKKLPFDLSLKLRLRNLLDPTAEFTQGDGVTREFKKGRELILSVEWKPAG